MELLISLAGSAVLYHITRISSAVKIVEENKFHLKPNEGTDAEAGLSKAAYYLSTTRTRLGSYTKQSVFSYSVVFVLDGNSISHRYRVQPVDYWETLKDAEPYNTDSAYVKRRDRNESEDRVLSEKPTIPALKYIREIHAHVNDKIPLLFKLKKAALLNKIPIWFYDDTEDLRLLRKAKARQIDFKKMSILPESVAPRAYEFKYRLRVNSIKPWLQLWHAKITGNKEPWKVAKELGDRAYACYQNVKYPDSIRTFSADLHNAKGIPPGEVSQEREMLDRLIGIMRKEKLSPKQFLEKLYEKYYTKE